MKYLQQSCITKNPFFFLMIIKKLLFRKLVINSDCIDPAKEKYWRLLIFFFFSVQFLYHDSLNSNGNFSPQTAFSIFKEIKYLVAKTKKKKKKRENYTKFLN